MWSYTVTVTLTIATTWLQIGPFGLVTPSSLSQHHGLCVTKHANLLCTCVYTCMWRTRCTHGSQKTTCRGWFSHSAMWTPSCQAWQRMILHAHQLIGPSAPCLNTNVNGVYVTQNLPREGTERLFVSFSQRNQREGILLP